MTSSQFAVSIYIVSLFACLSLTFSCEDVNDFIKIINFTNSVLYMKKEENDYSYVIKRLLDNEKKYECRNLLFCTEIIGTK